MVTVKISKYDIERLRIEYESCLEAGFKPDDEIIFPFYGIGYSRIGMERCKQLIEEGQALGVIKYIEVQVEMFNQPQQ